MAKKKIKRSKMPPNMFEEGGDIKQSWGQQSSAKAKEAFSAGNLGSSIGNIGGALGGIAKTGMENSQIADTSSIEALNKAQHNMVVSASTNDDLMSEWGTWNRVKDNYVWKDVRGGSSGQRATNTLGALGQGAATGASVGGPIGAVVGGIVGLGTAIGGWISGNRKAKKRARRLNEEAQEANSRALSSFETRAGNIDARNDFNLMANYSAYGGPLNFGGGAIGYEFANKQLNNQEMDIFSKQRLTSLPNSFQALPEMNTYNAFAHGGGLSRSRNYGSKEKPYPSVSSGEFAGPHRSYPIPTKADARDALRLAGLHDNQSVRRKVLSKYPSLKALGGPLLNEYISTDKTPIVLKEGGGIHIKKKNRGKFTDYCGGKVTSKCVAKGKRSSNPVTRKRATFAANARKWHQDGGPLGRNPFLTPEIYSGIIPYSPDFEYKNLVKKLPDEKVFEFIKYLENNEEKGIKNGIAWPYDETTAGYGTDFVKGSPHLAKKIKAGKFTQKEAKKKAIEDMQRGDRVIMGVMNKYTTRPDTISIGPRLLAAQARYQYGNLRNDIDKLGPAIANGKEDEIRRIILEKAKGHGERYNKLDSYDIYGDTYAYGGNLFQHGGDFSNGVTFINEGGLHEENPFEGVQIGIDPNGAPNLVEEGEVIYNDYVFSDRMGIPKDIKKEYKLKGKTFAKAAKYIQRESEERPNDPLSSRGLQAGMERVAQAQEEVRQRREVDREGNEYSDIFAYGGDLFEEELLPQIVSGVPYAPVYSQERPSVSPEKLRKELMGTGRLTPSVSTDSSKRQTLTRYAPIIGSGLASVADLFSSPDYDSADMISGVDLSPAVVDFSPIGNYLSYNPLDRDFYINKVNQQAAATRRALMDSSGGNRATAQAGILAADYNYGQSMGTLARQAEEYNQAQRERVEAFNRGTNMFNTEAGLKTSATNAESINAMNRARLGQAQSAAQMRQAIKDQDTVRRSTNISNFLQGLGDMGWENEQANWLDELARAGVLRMDTRGNKTACGGKIKTKKKKGLTYG